MMIKISENKAGANGKVNKESISTGLKQILLKMTNK